jgi:Kef-type K+ transport system membrane component KefB
VGYGFFIPLFFVAPGMGLDLPSIAENPLRLLVFFVLLLGVRGLPALVLYRRLLPLPKRFEMMFLTATPLPLLVALATSVRRKNRSNRTTRETTLHSSGSSSRAAYWTARRLTSMTTRSMSDSDGSVSRPSGTAAR